MFWIRYKAGPKRENAVACILAGSEMNSRFGLVLDIRFNAINLHDA